MRFKNKSSLNHNLAFNYSHAKYLWNLNHLEAFGAVFLLAFLAAALKLIFAAVLVGRHSRRKVPNLQREPEFNLLIAEASKTENIWYGDRMSSRVTPASAPPLQLHGKSISRPVDQKSLFIDHRVAGQTFPKLFLSFASEDSFQLVSTLWCISDPNSRPIFGSSLLGFSFLLLGSGILAKSA